MNNRRKNKEKGITLVALVVTIVVLLLLAGITIATLLGNNGIILRAQEAKEKTEIAKLTEIVGIAIDGLTIDHLGDTSKITPQEIAEEVKKNEGRTDVTAKDTTFPTYIVFEKEGKEIPVNLEGTPSESEDIADSMYSVPGVASKVAPPDLFTYEIISDGKIASTTLPSLPEKTAKITGIKSEYCSRDTNYAINYEGTAISDTLVIPYQVEIEGELYKIIDVHLAPGLPRVDTVIFPKTVTSFSTGATGSYDNPWSLRSIVLPPKIKRIKDASFSHCEALSEVKIPNGVEVIGDSAFNCCSSLKSINLPASVNSIGYGAFEDCSNLETISFSNSVVSIGVRAFANCDKVSTIYFDGTMEEFNALMDSNGYTFLSAKQVICSK